MGNTYFSKRDLCDNRSMKLRILKVPCLLLVAMQISSAILNCASSPQTQTNISKSNSTLLLSSRDRSFANPGIQFGIYPGYVQDPDKFMRANLGIGTFQGRHLLEDEVRKEAQRYIGTSNAHRSPVMPSSYFFIGGSASGIHAPKN